MNLIDFSKIADQQTFEKLAADLLEAEGFQVSKNTYPDQLGFGLLAEENIVSHAGLSHNVRWLVQCEYCGGKGRKLTQRDIERILYHFDDKPEDGLLIVTDTDISEDSLLLLEQYVPRSALRTSSPSETDTRREHLVMLHQILDLRFNEGELRTLCFDLGVDYDNLPGVGKADKARELIGHFDRRDQIYKLVKFGEQVRPGVFWRAISEQSPTDKRLIKTWNQRELENRLLRHPMLALKYGISTGPFSVSLSPFDGVDLKDKKILIVSDTSAFAYQLFTSINRVSPNVHMITIWQYGDPIRNDMILKDIFDTSFDLIAFFLGDTFGFSIPTQLIEKLLKTARMGKSVILFPFFAWAVFQGAYQAMDSLLPVKLTDQPRLEQLWLKASRILSTGDVTWLNPEAFIENQSVTIKVNGKHPILNGIAGDFGVIHSFEFLDLKSGAKCILSDSLGNPFIVVNEALDASIVYINSCTHNCLTKTTILSPFEVSESYQRLIVNTVLWCLGLK